MTKTTEPRVVVSHEGPGQPIMLTIYGQDGEIVAVPMVPKRALELAQELLTRGVQATSRRTNGAGNEPGARPGGGGVSGQLWEIGDIVKLVEGAEPKPGKRGPYKTRATEHAS